MPGTSTTQTAYIAINAIRRDDMRPHIYRTHDGGATWTHVVEGLHPMGPVNVVREDPQQPGLLFAGTERTIYFSIDDGDHWHSLRQNLPPSSMRDLVIHEDDLVVGTHGRSIWVLDNIAPLRELAQAVRRTRRTSSPRRWRPGCGGTCSRTRRCHPRSPRDRTHRTERSSTTSCRPTQKRSSLEIVSPDGDRTAPVLFRATHRKSSIPRPCPIPPTGFGHPQSLGTSAGHHRFVWDLRREPPPGARRQFAIAAVLENTPSGPHGPFVHPVEYTVRLTVDGQVQEQALEVRLDPRVEIDDESLQQQTDFSLRCYLGYLKAQEIREASSARAGVQPTASDWPLSRHSAARETPGEPDILYDYIVQAAAPRERDRSSTSNTSSSGCSMCSRAPTLGRPPRPRRR